MEWKLTKDEVPEDKEVVVVYFPATHGYENARLAYHNEDGWWDAVKKTGIIAPVAWTPVPGL